MSTQEFLDEYRAVSPDKWLMKPGDKFGKREVISAPFYKRCGANNRQHVKAKCSCGKVNTVICERLTAGRADKCNACSQKKQVLDSQPKLFKECGTCHKSLHADFFHTRNHKYRRSLVSECKNCMYYKTIFRVYGLTREDLERLVERQGDSCGICKKSKRDSHLNGRNWSIDHDHATGKVRGLLCEHCNKGLGHYFDSPTLMRAAAAYLDQHISNTSENVDGLGI